MDAGAVQLGSIHDKWLIHVAGANRFDDRDDQDLKGVTSCKVRMRDPEGGRSGAVCGAVWILVVTSTGPGGPTEILHSWLCRFSNFSPSPFPFFIQSRVGLMPSVPLIRPTERHTVHTPRSPHSRHDMHVTMSYQSKMRSTSTMDRSL